MASRGRGARNKGANFERDLAKKLSQHFGLDVKRTGGTERSKIVNKGDVNASKFQDTILNEIFWEAKNRESWAVLDWYKKACDDAAGTVLKPVVVCTKNFEKEYVFMSLDDLLSILYELEGYRKGGD